MSDRTRIGSGSPYESRYGFSRAVRIGDVVEVAGTAPIPPPGEEVDPTPYGQMMRCGEIALEAMRQLGASAADVVRTRMYIVDPADADEVGRGHAALFGKAQPVATMVVVKELVDPRWKVEIEVQAVIRPIDG